MKTVKKRDLVILVLSLTALVVFPSLAMAAGSLEPNAPPGPVMKSLDEVEPRIPIKASNLPLTITQRGSYYLTQDVNFTDTAHNAITVDCNDVTIDLMGYTLKGPDSGSYSGIYLYTNGRTGITVRNGTVRDFYFGIRAAANTFGHRVINIRAVSNLSYGITLGSAGNLVKDCTATENVDTGIFPGYRSTVTGNTASHNGGNGIYTADGCTVTGNTASRNILSGIYVIGGCTATGNTAYQNTTDGIRCEYYNTVTGNTCYANGYNGDGAGIHATSSGNRIEQNHVTANDRGIDVDGANNLIVKNSASGNTVEYDIVANNKVGTISSDPTTATAWANFNLE